MPSTWKRAVTVNVVAPLLPIEPRVRGYAYLFANEVDTRLHVQREIRHLRQTLDYIAKLFPPKRGFENIINLSLIHI